MGHFRFIQPLRDAKAFLCGLGFSWWSQMAVTNPTLHLRTRMCEAGRVEESGKFLLSYQGGIGCEFPYILSARTSSHAHTPLMSKTGFCSRKEGPSGSAALCFRIPSHQGVSVCP